MKSAIVNQPLQIDGLMKVQDDVMGGKGVKGHGDTHKRFTWRHKNKKKHQQWQLMTTSQNVNFMTSGFLNMALIRLGASVIRLHKQRSDSLTASIVNNAGILTCTQRRKNISYICYLMAPPRILS